MKLQLIPQISWLLLLTACGGNTDLSYMGGAGSGGLGGIGLIGSQTLQTDSVGGGNYVHRVEYTFENGSGNAATALDFTLPSGYVFYGGTTPGTGGTCAAPLAANSSCKIVIASPVIASSTPPSPTVTMTYNTGSGVQTTTVKGTGPDIAPQVGTMSCPGVVHGSAVSKSCSFASLSDDAGLGGLTASLDSGSHTCSFITGVNMSNGVATLTGSDPGVGAAGSTCTVAVKVSDAAGNSVTKTSSLKVFTEQVFAAGCGTTAITAGNVATYQDKAWRIQSGCTVRIEVDQNIPIGPLTVEAGGTLTHLANTGANTYRIDLTVDGDASVASTGAITADGRGYLGAQTTGYTYPNTTVGGSVNGNAGASHGGLGGADTGQTPPSVYGNLYEPMTHGGGGGGGNNGANVGSSGGGVIKLTVGGTFTINGPITSNYGGGVNGGWNSGGAGGSIWIDAGRIELAGSAALQARGGFAGVTAGGGGGGGRIALYYASISGDPTSYINVSGGDSSVSTRDGQPGTAFLKRKDQQYGKIYVSDAGQSMDPDTDMTMGFSGTIASVDSATQITVSGGKLIANMLVGKTINPNLEGTTTMVVTANTASTITIGAGNFTTSTAANKYWAMTDMGTQFDEVEIAGTNTTVSFPYLIATNYTSSGSIHIKGSAAKVTPLRTTAAAYAPLRLTADSVTINSGNSLYAQGYGYLGSNNSGTTVGFAATMVGDQSASHGGIGSSSSNTTSSYGDPLNPSLPGGGAGGPNNAMARGGNGGGVLLLTINHLLTLNGSIDADGNDWTNNGSDYAGGGAGGSIKLIVNKLKSTSLTPVISVNGGNGGPNANTSGGGGGGRLYIQYTSLDGIALTAGIVQAYGGKQAVPTARAGSQGSIVVKGPQHAVGKLILANDNATAPSSNTVTAFDMSGMVSSVTASTLTVTGINLSGVDLTGKTLVPDIYDPTTTYTITGNTATVISTGGVDVNTKTTSSRLWAVVDHALYDEIEVSRMAVAKAYRLSATRSDGTGMLTVKDAGTVLTSHNTSTAGIASLRIHADNVTVENGGAIDVSGRGYAGAAGTAFTYAAGTPAQPTQTGGAQFGNCGGSHGGQGGNNGCGSARATYGSSSAPILPGGGGGGNGGGEVGGNGGGVLRMTVNDTLYWNGSILADGADYGTSSNYVGGGAGGSIWITTQRLVNSSGTPIMGARGGVGGTNASASGGGGGRIKLSYSQSTGVVPSASNVIVTGGDNVNAAITDGAAGSAEY